MLARAERPRRSCSGATKLNSSDGTRNNNAVKYKNDFGPLLFEMDNSFGGVAGNFGGEATRSVGVSYHLGPADIGGVIKPDIVLRAAAIRPPSRMTRPAAAVCR
jgi:predicted porin